MGVFYEERQHEMYVTSTKQSRNREYTTYLSGIWNEKGKTFLPLPTTSVPGGESMIRMLRD